MGYLRGWEPGEIGNIFRNIAQVSAIRSSRAPAAIGKTHRGGGNTVEGDRNRECMVREAGSSRRPPPPPLLPQQR